jgi:large subunit ribosomal protein L5
MATMTETAPPARLKARYLEEIRPELMSRFGYSSVMQAPRLEKITLNMGVGDAKQDSKALKAAVEQLATIAGQQPSVRRARKSIAAFKLREGMPVGVAVTLRGERSYEFLDRLVSIAIPRIRDFRGLNPRSFDGRGNYSMGVREQIIFPEIDYDAIDQVRGLDITITTSAASDAEAFALLFAFGMPFATQGRPKGFNEAAGVEAEPEPAPEAPSKSRPQQAQDAAPEVEAAPEPHDAAPEVEAAPEPHDSALEVEGGDADAEDSAPDAETAEPEPPAAAEAQAAAPEASSAGDEEQAAEPETGSAQAENDAEAAAEADEQDNAEKESSA